MSKQQPSRSHQVANCVQIKCGWPTHLAKIQTSSAERSVPKAYQNSSVEFIGETANISYRPRYI